MPGLRQDQSVDLSRLTTEYDVLGLPTRKSAVDDSCDAVESVLQALGGVTLDGGLYRCHASTSVSAMTALATDAFPEFADRAVCFGADWLGRQFAADDARRDATGVPLVLMFEPGTGEALEIPATVTDFHENRLVDDAEPALARSFYLAWRAKSVDERPLELNECVGYRVPLFLGGSDDVENLERTDLDVYWTFAAQLRRGTRDLPPGAPVSAIKAKKRGWRTR
jgi:hypothetical protein